MMTLIHVWTMLVAAGATPFLDTRGLIEQALSEPTKITLENVKLSEAIAEVTEQTGVRVVMSPEVMQLTPQGPDTLIQKVDIAQMPLREGLTRLFGPLGMTWLVRQDCVEVVPKEAILCLGRVPTWPELEMLSELSAMQPGLDATALAKLQGRVQFQMPVPDAWRMLSDAIRNVGAGPGDEVLSLASRGLGWGWCLSGPRIVVSPLEEQVRRRLQQPISLRMNNRPLFDVMNAVGAPVNIAVRAEPGALTSLPMQVQRNFSLNAQQLPVEQVLDTISANTGLGYLVGPEGVLFYRPEARGSDPKTAESSGSAPAPAAADPYVAKMVIPLEGGKAIEWLIRRSELPEDLRQMRERDIEAVIATLRQRSGTASRP